ncbi:MAG TPA: HNH endonuclease signature motif containing protein, partial [Kribbellaceae bacterium]
RLSRSAAALVDARVAPIADTVTTYRLDRIVRAAVLDADPDQAQADADAQATDRGVWVGRDDLHGSKTVVIKAAAGDVLRLDASTDRIADLLARLGDTSTKDQRRAKAIGWLADPQATLALYGMVAAGAAKPGGRAESGGAESGGGAAGPAALAPVTPIRDTTPGTRSGTGEGGRGRGEGGNTGPGLPTGTGTGRGGLPAGPVPRPGGLGRHTLYVHLTDHTLATGTGLVRTDHDRLGPLLASQLRELLGHDQVVVKPVIDLADRISVDAYEIPDRIRERVQLRYTHCVFPYCNRPVRATDLDHVIPYDDTGPPGQTSTDNLGPECRLHHRVKTHGNWRCRRLPDGAFEWTSPHGHLYRVDHTGTHPIRSGVDRAAG